MRTFLFAAVASAALGVVALTPAKSQASWVSEALHAMFDPNYGGYRGDPRYGYYPPGRYAPPYRFDGSPYYSPNGYRSGYGYGPYDRPYQRPGYGPGYRWDAGRGWYGQRPYRW